MNEFDIMDMIDSVGDMSILHELEECLPDDMAYLATEKLEQNGIKV